MLHFKSGDVIQFLKRYEKEQLLAFGTIVLVLAVMVTYFLQQTIRAKNDILLLGSEKEKTATAYNSLKNQDQYKINQQLKEEVKKTHDTYADSITAYESMLDLQVKKQDTTKLTDLYASIVKNLADLKYATAESDLKDLNTQIKKINDDLAAKAAALSAAGAPAGPATESNNPPGSGYSYQAVKTEIGTYNIAIISADLNSTKVIIDTASDGDCHDNCPVLALGDYVSRSGAFAGVNGSYFCPASYPTCAGKTNSFDTLLMNKNKVYFNSDNNVYSNVPVNIAFSGGSDPKQGSKGARSFVGNKGSTVYIGVIYNVTVAEMAYVLKSLGLENALNLDSGGSTALWSGGYKAGPGRNIPNAVLFVRR